jgi:hypothetical protein
LRTAVGFLVGVGDFGKLAVFPGSTVASRTGAEPAAGREQQGSDQRRDEARSFLDQHPVGVDRHQHADAEEQVTSAVPP